MKLADLHIAVSPLTERIYMGTLDKRHPDQWSSKIDFTSKFLGVLMVWCPAGTRRVITDNKGNRYEILVRELPTEEDQS